MNLCGRLGANSIKNTDRIGVSMSTADANNSPVFNNRNLSDKEDNCFLRIHIPFPAKKDALTHETKCKDVVLYE